MSDAGQKVVRGLKQAVAHAKSDEGLAMRLRLHANQIDPENPSRQFPSAMETRDLLNAAARRIEALSARKRRPSNAEGAKGSTE